MKNLSKYSIWPVLILAIGLFASGCAESPMIEATDGTVSSGIVIEWVWPGDSYTLKRAISPLPSDTWTDVYTGTDTTFNDATALTDTIYFYKVVGDTTSWPNGGYYGTVPIDPEGALLEKFKLWERANGCIHNYTNVLHPDPASELPIHDPITGSTGTMLLDMALVAQDSLDAVAEFTYTNYLDTCTNTYTMSGYQYAPVDVANYDGIFRGYVDWGNGWAVYECEITNKDTTGGHWYAGDSSGVELFNYPVQEEGTCEEDCDASCCP